MKPMIVGISIILLCCYVFIFWYDLGEARARNYELKYAASEVSVSASLFLNLEEYSNGSKVFNRIEGNKAIDNQLRKLLKLDESLNPLPKSYWQDTISYKVYYFDDSDTVYPHLFKDSYTGFTYTITSPTVIVTINAGRARFRLPAFQGGAPVIRSAAHEWKGQGDRYLVPF
jgi:hypothetical protein